MKHEIRSVQWSEIKPGDTIVTFQGLKMQVASIKPTEHDPFCGNFWFAVVFSDGQRQKAWGNWKVEKA